MKRAVLAATRTWASSSRATGSVRSSRARPGSSPTSSRNSSVTREASPVDAGTTLSGVLCRMSRRYRRSRGFGPADRASADRAPADWPATVT
jgi:hypothetical protein